MSLLSDGDLTAMRTTLNQSLAGTAIIQNRSYTSDSGGGGTIAYTAAGTVSARVAPLTGNEHVTGERLGPYSSWIITLPANTVVVESDRIVIGSDTFEVETVRGARTYELSRRVEANKVSN